MGTKLCTIVVAFGILFFVNSCKQPTTPAYEISQRDDGYIIKVPQEILRNFRKTTEIQVELDDPDQGKTMVTGEALKLSDNSFKIKTDQKFRYQGKPGKTWLLIRGLVLGEVSDDTNCSGCPRDSKLQIYEDGTVCWCWAE